MPRQHSIITIRLVEVLGDYEWHDREETIRLVMPSVPPGRAYRWLEASRKSSWLRKNPGKTPDDIPPRRKKHTPDRLIRMGQRAIVMNAIGSFDRVEVDIPNNRVRLLPPRGFFSYLTAEERKMLEESKPPRFSDLPPEQRHASYAQRANKGWQTRRQARAANNGSSTPEGHQPQKGTDN